MKKLLLFFSLLLSLLPLSTAAETYTVIYKDLATISSSTTAPKKNHVLLNTGKIGWDITSNSTYLAKDGTDPKGIKLGKKAEPATIATFASSDNENSPFKGKIIKSAIINAGGSNAITNPTLELYVDETKVGETKTLAAGTHTECQFDNIDIICQSSVKIVLQQTNSSTKNANSLTLGDFSITYEDAPVGPVDYTLDITNALTLEEGQDFDISGFDIPADAPALTWTSSDENVVAVIDGTLLAGEAGTATLTASWEASEKYNAGHHDIAVTVTNPLAAETPVIKYNGEVVDGDEIEVKYNSELSVESANATSIKIEKTGSAPVVIEGNKGTFVADVEEIYTITAIGKGGNAEKVIMISFLKAGMPTITINGKQIENNCFYNVTENIPALISAENAVSYTILAPNAGEVDIDDNGSFTITSTGEYLATASNGVDDSDTFSFTIGKLLEAQPGEPVEPVYVWRKVTTVEDLTEEGEYLIAATGQNKAISTAVDGSNDYYRPNIDVTIVDGDINSLPTSGTSTAMIFNIEKTTAGTIYWKATNFEGSTDKGSYLYSMNSSKNYLQIGAKTNSQNVDVAATSVTISNDGVTTITLTNCKNNETARRLQYNKNETSNKFGGYTGNQEPVDIYKKINITHEPENKIEVVEYLPKITAEGQLTFANDEVAKVLKFESKIPGVRFNHCTEKNAPAQKSMHKAPQAATWTELINGEYDHSDNEHGTHIWVKALKDSRVNEATIESPEFWQFITPEGTTTGIEGVAAEAEGEGELYNLQGARVDRRSAAPGLYIERRGGKAVKVIL